MTIPVDNAPTYEVGQRPPAPDPEEARAIAALLADDALAAPRPASESERPGASIRMETPSGARVVRLPRGCLFGALALTGLTLACGGAILFGVLGGGFEAVRDQTLAKIAGDLRNTAEAQGSLAAHAGELAQLDELRTQRRVGWLAFSVLTNRWTDVKADRVITPAELEHVMIVVRDIDARGGDIDPADYPDGR